MSVDKLVTKHRRSLFEWATPGHGDVVLWCEVNRVLSDAPVYTFHVAARSPLTGAWLTEDPNYLRVARGDKIYGWARVGRPLHAVRRLLFGGNGRASRGNTEIFSAGTIDEATMRAWLAPLAHPPVD